MKLTATVSFDLLGAAPAKYAKFYAELQTRHWQRKDDVNSTVTARFREGIDYAGVVRRTTKDFDAAAETVGVKYTAELAVGYPPVQLPQ